MFSRKSSSVSFADRNPKRRACATCRGIMKLVSIEPGKPGLNLHTFECPACKTLESATVSTDPMASGGNGWASSYLHEPR